MNEIQVRIAGGRCENKELDMIKIALALILVIYMGGVALAETVRIVMSTSQGNIEIDLYVDQAPITAGNFLRLVDSGQMDGGFFIASSATRTTKVARRLK